MEEKLISGTFLAESLAKSTIFFTPQCNVFSPLLYYAVQELIGQGLRVNLYLQRAMVTGDTTRDTARDSGASQSVKQRGYSEERSAYGRTDGQSNYLLLGVILNLAHSSFVTILF